MMRHSRSVSRPPLYWIAGVATSGRSSRDEEWRIMQMGQPWSRRSRVRAGRGVPREIPTADGAAYEHHMRAISGSSRIRPASCPFYSKINLRLGRV